MSMAVLITLYDYTLLHFYSLKPYLPFAARRLSWLAHYTYYLRERWCSFAGSHPFSMVESPDDTIREVLKIFHESDAGS